jgi:hypothetical protein
VLSEAKEMYPSCGVFDTEEHIDPLQEHGVDVQEIDGENASAWAARNCCQVGPDRRGAGCRLALIKIVRTVLGQMRCPRPRSSPAMRW